MIWVITSRKRLSLRPWRRVAPRRKPEKLLAEKPLDRIASLAIIPTVKPPSTFGSTCLFFLRSNKKAAAEDVHERIPKGILFRDEIAPSPYFESYDARA